MSLAAATLPSPLPADTGDAHRAWVARAISVLMAEQARSADTHLVAVPLSNAPGISLYLKDESSHPSGSLSTGWRARCSFMRCATAGSPRA
jgi:cysteine synthase A